jgi:hypothetical protein
MPGTPDGCSGTEGIGHDEDLIYITCMEAMQRGEMFFFFSPDQNGSPFARYVREAVVRGKVPCISCFSPARRPSIILVDHSE